MDQGYAAATQFGGRVVHGLLSRLRSLSGRNADPGSTCALPRPGPVLSSAGTCRRNGRASARVTGKIDATRTVVLATDIRNGEGKVAVSGSAKVKVRDSDTGPVPVVATPSSGTVSPPTQHKVALVTGASRGIGAAVVKTLAARGIAVAVNYFRNGDRANQIIGAIRDTGGKAIAVRADVRDQAESRRLVHTVVETFGGLDMLVKSARPARFSRVRSWSSTGLPSRSISSIR